MHSVLHIKLFVNSRILTPFGWNANEREVQKSNKYLLQLHI